MKTILNCIYLHTLNKSGLMLFYQVFILFWFNEDTLKIVERIYKPLIRRFEGPDVSNLFLNGQYIIYLLNLIILLQFCYVNFSQFVRPLKKNLLTVISTKRTIIILIQYCVRILFFIQRCTIIIQSIVSIVRIKTWDVGRLWVENFKKYFCYHLKRFL